MGEIFDTLFYNKKFDNSSAATPKLISSSNVQDVQDIGTCFTHSTLIATTKGECRVEELQRGDRVITRDNGIQQICWIGSYQVTSQTLQESPDFRPVLIRKGALGGDSPEQDMLVSPEQGILITDAFIQCLQEGEVLVPAKYLTGFEGIEIADVTSVHYICIMFEQHEVVLSNGVWSESMHPNSHSLAKINDSEFCEIIKLFPRLETQAESVTPARRSLKHDEAIMLVS